MSLTIYVNTAVLFNVTPLEFIIVNATDQSIEFGLFGYYGEPYCIGNGTITIPTYTPVSTPTPQAVASLVTFKYKAQGLREYF